MARPLPMILAATEARNVGDIMQTRRDFLFTGVSIVGAMSFAACGPAEGTEKASDKAVPPRQEGKVVKVQVYNKSGQLVPVDQKKVVKTDEEWKKQLTPE